MIRVLVVDDSPISRELIASILDEAPGISVVGRAANGREAVSMVDTLSPNVVTMDVHMPILDGFSATSQIMAKKPTPILVVSSTSGRGGMDLMFESLRAGALTAIDKPEGPTSPHFEKRVRELVHLVRVVAGVRVTRRAPTAAASASAALPPLPRVPRRNVTLVAIGASVGGPLALENILSGLPPDFPPIVVTQHMSAGFIGGLASWLQRSTQKAVAVARDEDRLLPSCVYLAPDRAHLGVVAGGSRIRLDSGEAVGGFRPSVDAMFRSVAQDVGASAIGCLLTGMGRDGADGLLSMKTAGAWTIAQDEATAIVWGMPGCAVAEGAASEVLALSVIATRLAGPGT